MHSQLVIFLLIAIATVAYGRSAGECVDVCNDLRTEVLSLEMCKEAKRTLPRPKVGDFCSTAMEQGFSDACVSLCTEQMPVSRVAQACRAAAVEMPRPTVRKWCEHGYNVAFAKTRGELKSHFTVDRVLNETPPASDGAASATAETTEPKADEGATDNEPDMTGQEILTTVPITLEDKPLELVVYVGQNAEEAVVSFCRKHVTEDVAACIRQLIPVVLERVEALGSASAGSA